MKAPKAIPTLEDVARLAGVSTATVSRCINEPHRVLEATRENVMQVIDQLGYAPNFGARALVLNRTNIMGAVIPTMDNAIFSRFLQALEERLAEDRITLIVSTSNYSLERELDQIRTLMSRGVDGLILIGRERDERAYRLLDQRKMPFVLAWAWKLDCPHICVGFDNEEAGALVAQEVVKCGHQRLGMIAGITAGNDRAAERLLGVRRAAKKAGFPLMPHHVVEAKYCFESGRAAFVEMMEKKPRPTAVICGNDVLAIGALEGARKAGMHVPGDVSVVGFDDIDFARFCCPPLTTVHVPHRRMGRLAGEKLLAMRGNDFDGASQHIGVEFVWRDSLAAPASKDV
jgi:LacI family transcriptional regulator